MSEYDIGSPTIGVKVYGPHGELVTFVRCESTDEAADVAADWEEQDGFICEVADLAERHAADDILASDPEDTLPDLEYRGDNV
jgi:hypothetical protein